MRPQFVLALLVGLLPAAARGQQADGFEQELRQAIGRLDPTQPQDVKLAALRWVNIHSREQGIEQVVPALEKLCQDGDARVRAEGLNQLGIVQLVRQQPCPLALIEAWDDPDEYARTVALGNSWNFRAVPAAAINLLKRYEKSPNLETRCNAIYFLGLTRPLSDDVLALLRDRRRHENFRVRHEAHFAVYRATGKKLDEIVPYVLEVKEGKAWENVPGDPEKWTEEQKAEQAQKNLFRLGVGGFLTGVAEERPREFAGYLLKLCQEGEPWQRKSAVLTLGGTIRLLATPQPASPFATPPWQEDKKPEPFDLSVFQKLKVDEAFRALQKNDPDPEVRQAAGEALKMWAEAIAGPQAQPAGGWAEQLLPYIEPAPLYKTPDARDAPAPQGPGGPVLPPDLQRRFPSIRDGTSNVVPFEPEDKKKAPRRWSD